MATLSLGRRDTTSYFVSGLGYLVCRSTKIFHSKLGRLAGACGVHPRNILEFQKNGSRTREGDPGCTGSYWRHRQITANTFSKMVDGSGGESGGSWRIVINNCDRQS